MKWKDHCFRAIKKLYKEWRCLQKNASDPQTSIQITKEQKFQLDLNNLFDIAHANALTIVNIDEYREFLQLQRQPGRSSSITGIDQVLARKESNKWKRKVSVKSYQKRKKEELEQIGGSLE